MHLFETKGLKYYKKYYEPREEWFKSQREDLRRFRQDFYLLSTGTPSSPTLTGESEPSTDDFMSNIALVAHSSLITDDAGEGMVSEDEDLLA